MRALFVVVGAVTLVVGCGGGGGASLDCTYLASDSNCWKTTASAAASCLPAATDIGTLSADNGTCVYANGIKVTFTPALVFPITSSTLWNFTVSNGDAECLHYESTKAVTKLVVQDKTVAEGSSGGLGLSLTCPDGTSYATSNVFDLLSCGADGGVSLGGLPGTAYSSSDDSVSFGLLGASADEETVFSCSKTPPP